ncbi:MAG: hypothetical protein M1818_002059 [Claussenomyces sp. TS43310]|nr:MAG: hypothetical protein M1818_002059 [Claussenomyces sp. TS43310]
MDALPSEIILHVANFLDPVSIARLQLVCRRFLRIARDSRLWRNYCFEKSSYLDALRRRRHFFVSRPAHGEPSAVALQPTSGAISDGGTNVLPNPEERARILANWDPSYSTEKIDWYTEFIHRSAPICVSWLQQPRNRESAANEHLEVRGVGTYNPMDDEDKSFAIAPLDDGSVCLWDLSKAAGRKGAIIGRSSSDILLSPGTGTRSRMVNTGVIECVTVNSWHKKAYVAVQSKIDLETLQAVGREKFPFSISALSESKGSTPMTVGTNLSLHLHDPRATQWHLQNHSVHLDAGPTPVGRGKRSAFRNIFDPVSRPNYAPLFRPGPLSILHLASSANDSDSNNDIYVAGRFPSILNYDRRYFPKLRGTIHSGARLSSMASIPHAFSAHDKERMRRGEFSVQQVEGSKSVPGSTLVACGEYNSKGSLELYGVSPVPNLSTSSMQSSGVVAHDSVFKNRQTSSSSKLLSVSEHGTRLVFSDGGGNIKWVERDGVTEVRCWNLAHGSAEAPRGIFGTVGDSYMDSGAGDVARKILHVKSDRTNLSANEDDLLLWTGEKVGLLTFASKSSFTFDDLDGRKRTLQDIHNEREERIYAQTMRRALERQADEVRFVRGLGLGLG